MPTWEELQTAFNRQESAWDGYWNDLMDQASVTKGAFKDYLGITDNILRREGHDPLNKVELGRQVDGTWEPCSKRHLDGLDRYVDFGIGVSTLHGRRASTLFVGIRLHKDHDEYVYELHSPNEEIRVRPASAQDDLQYLCSAIYQRIKGEFSKLP
jgi:hypothetical protein